VEEEQETQKKKINGQEYFISICRIISAMVLTGQFVPSTIRDKNLGKTIHPHICKSSYTLLPSRN
jgi:hypothetical protein